ncbi:MAG: hypothetical protein ABSE73_09945 [Planctomycetota bacterium]
MPKTKWAMLSSEDWWAVWLGLAIFAHLDISGPQIHHRVAFCIAGNDAEVDEPLR